MLAPGPRVEAGPRLNKVSAEANAGFLAWDLRNMMLM